MLSFHGSAAAGTEGQEGNFFPVPCTEGLTWVARFQVASPSSGLGSRLVQGQPMNPGVMAAWDARLYNLLCWKSPVTLKMTEKAAEAYRQWGLEV